MVEFVFVIKIKQQEGNILILLSHLFSFKISPSCGRKILKFSISSFDLLWIQFFLATVFAYLQASLLRCSAKFFLFSTNQLCNLPVNWHPANKFWNDFPFRFFFCSVCYLVLVIFLWKVKYIGVPGWLRWISICFLLRS